MPTPAPTPRRLAAGLLLLVALIGLTGALGRHYGSQEWGGWIPGAVTMKEITGGLFVFHAAWLGCRARFTGPWWANLLFGSGVLVGLFVLAGVLRGILSFEVLWSTDPRTSLFPSIYTVACFLFASVAELFCLVSLARRARAACGSLVAAAGATGLAGYLLHAPRLYGHLPGVSTAVAPPTCAAFVLLGLALLLMDTTASPLALERDRLDAVSLIRRFTVEHLGIAYALCWGAWAVVFSSFDYAAALKAADDALKFTHTESEYLYAAVLGIGAGLQIAGLRWHWMPGRIQGALLHFGVFFSICASAFFGNFRGTAPINYLFVAGSYLLLALRLSTRPTLRRNLFGSNPENP